MTEIKMTRKATETMVKDVVETKVPRLIGTAGISIGPGKIITKIDVVIAEMFLTEQVKTWCNDGGEWYVVPRFHY